jgi:hypothetical protein
MKKERGGHEVIDASGHDVTRSCQTPTLAKTRLDALPRPHFYLPISSTLLTTIFNMCRTCDRGFDLTPHGIVFGDDNRRGGGGGGGGFLWDPTWNEVSGRALEEGKRVFPSLSSDVCALNDVAGMRQAERIFLDFLSRADTSRGPVTQEIINFHLVQKVLKQFCDFVKARGCMYALVLVYSDACTAHVPRIQPQGPEVDPRGAKQNQEAPQVGQYCACEMSVVPTHCTVQLMTYTSITVTKEAQDTYFKANPHLTPPVPVASSSSEDPTHASSASKTKKKRDADLDSVDDSTAPNLKKKKTTKL